MTPATDTESGNRKLSQLLDAAMDVFMRYGFRKTSMNDVAEAAGISRQGLYLHFTSKEELFKAALLHHITTMKAEVDLLLAKADTPLAERLFLALDAVMGDHVGKFNSDAFDLFEACELLAGDFIDNALKELCAKLAASIAEAQVADKSLLPDITCEDRASTLLAIADGLKHKADTREDFKRELRTGIRVVLAPLKLKAKCECGQEIRRAISAVMAPLKRK